MIPIIVTMTNEWLNASLSLKAQQWWVQILVWHAKFLKNSPVPLTVIHANSQIELNWNQQLLYRQFSFREVTLEITGTAEHMKNCFLWMENSGILISVPPTVY